jgi:polysaccharide export outer membrane protein
MIRSIRTFTVLAVTALSGCGAAYIAPKVSESDANVRVISITADSIAAANAQSYAPKTLPSVFFASAGAGGSLRGAGALPEPTLDSRPNPESIALSVPPAADPGPYRIGTGDVVLIATRSRGSTVEELTGLLAAQNRRQGYTVQDDGAIAIPEVGRVILGGQTLEEAEARVFQTLVENGIDPSFSIEIAEFNSARVAIGGAVARPAVAPVTLTPLRLDEALAAAGGVATKDLDFATIRIYRDGQLYQIPLSTYLERPDLQRTRLIGGDSIFVDTSYDLDQAQSYFQEQITLTTIRNASRQQALNELQTAVSLRRAELSEQRSNFSAQLELDSVDRDFVYITGEVLKPGRIALPFGRQASLADTLLGGSGYSVEKANPSQIYVLRASPDPRDGGKVTAWHLNAKNPVNLILATKFEMRPNDIVFVEEQPITKWNRTIQQIIPTLITTSIAAATN